MVFLKIEMKGKVVAPSDQLDSTYSLLRNNIYVSLFHYIARKRESKEHGCYVVVNSLDSLGVGVVNNLTGKAIIPISFTCTTVKPCEGEVLIGTVDKVLAHGIFLKSGPIENIFLSEKLMGCYRFRSGEESMFVNELCGSKMEKGGKVRFRVFGTKWIERDSELHVLATIEGDLLGPI